MAHHNRMPLAMRGVVSASLVAVAGLPLSVWAQAPAPVQTPALVPDKPQAPAAASAQGDGKLRFNFKEAPLDQVLDFFARQSGVPIIFEAAAPAGALTFVSAGTYSFEEAMSILNLNLVRFGVHLRREANYMYLSTLQDSMRKPMPVMGVNELNTKPDDVIVTVSIPLDNARVDQVAEQVKAMISPFGGVLAVTTQNMLIVVETAAQVRRIREVVQAIDSVKPADSAFRLFPLRHAQVDAVLNALRGLVGEKIRTVIVDPDGKRRVVDEDKIAGLSLAADPRTNSIIGVGPEAKLRTVEELIGLLDVPESNNGETQVVSFSLQQLSADEAARQVNVLFATGDAKLRPVVIPVPAAAKITLVGPRASLAKAQAVLAELDPGVAADGVGSSATLGGERRAVTIPLTNITPQAFEAIAAKLLTSRQSQVVKFVASPDGRGMVVAGPDADVAAFQSLAKALDSTPKVEREVRLVRIAGENPKAVLAKVMEVLAKSGKNERDSVEASLDDSTGALTVIGSRAALTNFDQVLQSVKSVAAGEREVRTFMLSRAAPSLVAKRLAAIAPAVLVKSGAPLAEFEGVDELRTLVVRALPEQFSVLTGMVAQLDAADAGVRDLKIVPIAREKAAEVRDRAMTLYSAQSKDSENAGSLEVTVDDGANSLVVIGDAPAVRRFTAVLEQLQKQVSAQREVRLVEVREAKATDVAATLRDLIKTTQAFAVQGGGEPVVEVIEATNTLLVAAQPTQFAILDGLVKSLDRLPAADKPPTKILRLRATDAANLAGVLQRTYDGRPPEQRSAKPVTIEADTGTNTLIVTADTEIFPEIEAMVSQLNADAMNADGREIRIFPLRVARAEDLAQTLDQMFPEPPTPLDPRTRQPRPDLRPAREVVVRADRSTNALIVDAPARRLAGFEQLVRSLDQQKLGEDVLLRTYKVERADLRAVESAIRSLASSGSLLAPGASGAPITVSSEPATRTLIISGPEAVFAKIEEVLTKVDAAPALPPTELKMYALLNARSERLQPLIERLLTARAREQLAAQDKPAPDAARLVEVSSDLASNTLIISASREVLAVADGLIKALDQKSVAGGVEVRVLRLGKGVAATVAPAVAAAVKAQSGPGEPEASVTAEPGSNTVVVVGTPAQIEKAAKLVESMDQSVDRDGLGVKSLTLKFARAEAVAPVLESVLRRESALEKLPEWARAQAISRGATEAPQVRVAAEPRLNTLVVSGPKSVIDVAEQIVAELDVDPSTRAAAPQRPVRVVTLKNADAAQLAVNLQAVFADDNSGEPAPTIRVDNASNSLIVRATDTQMQTVDELTRKLDSAAATSTRQVRTIPVDRSRVDAELLAQTLRRMLEQQGGVKVEVIPADQLLRDTKDSPATPPADPAAAPKKVGRVDPARGERSQLYGMISLRAAPFIAASWSAIGLLNELPAAGEQPVAEPDDDGIVIAVDKASNSLVLMGSPRLTERIAGLAAALEREMPREPVGVRVLELGTSTDTEALAAILRQTIQQVGRSSPANAGGFTGPVSVITDAAAGSLVVLSNDTDFETVSRLITALNSTSGPAASNELTVKVYPLTSVTAAKAIAAVRDLFSSAPVGRQTQRVRAIDIELSGPAGAVSGRIDPARVRMTSDPAGVSIIVAAPREAMPIIDRLIETLDQSPATDRLAIRRYTLSNARAADLARTMQSLFDAQRQGPASNDLPQARFVADDRSNALLVTASSAQHTDVERLIASADASQDLPDTELAIITLRQAAPSAVQRIVEEVLVGRDPAKKERLRISAQDGSSLFVVRAPREDIAQVRQIVAQVDSGESGGLPVRSVRLERADAGVVAAALQKFFTDRANAAGRAGGKNRVAIVGDKRSGTLVVSATDDDFAQVESLLKTFDAQSPAKDMQFRVIALQHADVQDIVGTLKGVVEELRWERMMSSWNGQEAASGASVYIEPNARSNSVVVAGSVEGLETVEHVIAALDQPPGERAQMTIKAVKVKHADLQALRSALQRAFTPQNARSWRGQDDNAIQIEIDRAQRALILVGKSDRVDQAAKYISQLDGDNGAGEVGKVEAITLSHAKADRAATSLRQFFADRAKIQGVDNAGVSIVGSADGNVLIVSADEDRLKTLRDLVAQIDQPEGGKDRRIEVYVLKNAQSRETADALRSMFVRGEKADEQIVVTPQPSTNALIVSAPAAVFDEVAALLAQLDAPPDADETNIETVALTTARAQEVATALRGALPPNVKVTITPVIRSNSLLLTGSKEAIAVVIDQIKKIDTEPVRSGLIFRRYRLANADASDVAFTLDQVVRARPKAPNDPGTTVDYARAENTLSIYAPADQIEEMEKIIRDLDQPSGDDRTTEFVKLEFANAQQTATALKVFYGRFAPEAATPAARNVTILSDPLSNSLVIRADKAQWDGIRALLAKLDTKDYDTTRQLSVIALANADAASVARALNEGLRAPLEEQLRQAASRLPQTRVGGNAGNNRNEQRPEATVLVDAGSLPTVSAEPQTNSLIVFAGGKELERIEQIVRQLDVSGFKDMPAPRIVALKAGKPTLIATTIRQLYLNRPDQPKATGPKSVLIIGDDSSGTLIVRAEEEDFAQIKALADTLDAQGQIGRVQPHVVRLTNLAAGRLRQTLLATFTETAKAQGETLAIEVDRTNNALVIACSARLLEEIQKVITELDTPALIPGDAAGVQPPSPLSQSVTVIDINNNAPAEIVKIIESMGLTKPLAADRQGVTSEPITVVPLATRRAIAVVASPADARAVEALIRSLDAEPVDSQQQVTVIALKLASARPLAATLTQMLGNGDQASKTGPALALAEQVRRLNLSRNGADQKPIQLDLSRPIRIMADEASNTLVIASTQGNIDALREVVRLLDTLPMGEAVIVRIFMLENASASRIKQVVDQLFASGEKLRRVPGTTRQGLPPTATGRALAGELSVAIDERTNALVVAGREEGVALVEVLIKDLDSDGSSKWVEPMVLPLKFADAAGLARRLTDILVRGMAVTPEAMGLQRQFGRLRVLARQGAPDSITPEGQAVIEADLFAPVTGLVITPEEQMNALLVVGTPANNAVVRELVAMLDVEAASAANTVRVYPLKFAAADRVSAVARDIFRQRESMPDARPEDRVIITSDARTNALLVSTSGKSFAILEGLLKTMDAEKSNFSVGFHVLPVPNADVRLLAPKVERLMRERLQAAAQVGSVRSPLDAFSIEPEPASHLLIIAASDENFQVIKELVAALTADAERAAGLERVDLVQLKRIRATEATDNLRSLYVDKENARRGVNAVSVVPNERLNALVISGNEQDIIELRALINRLDNAEVTALQQIKWIELKSASATEVVRLLESVLAGRPVGGGRGLGARQATKLQFLRERVVQTLENGAGRPPTEADVDGAIKDQVTLTPDTRTNSVWITAPEPITRLLTEMIEDIERSTAGARRIEHFKLANSDATQMATLLRDIFNLRQRGDALVLVPTGVEEPLPNAAAPAADGVLGSSVTAVTDERQQLAIAVDRRTNTLIVSGTEDYLDLVRKVIAELDAIEATERDRRVYHLRNANAKEIETTLKSYFKGESDLERQTLGPNLAGSLMRRLEEEVTVVGDEKSNKLVVSTSPRYMDAVLQIVKELDAAPPQVMIQVLLAEVTLDNEGTFGMDIRVGPFGGEGYTIGSLAASAGVATSLGVPNLSVTSADFGILIRSLEAQGKLEVLSNPQVMVNNNQEAKIQVGENIAIVDGVERSSQGNSFADVIRQDVGIILNVKPSISVDGFVRMDIKPEISQLSAKTTQVAAGVTSPIITKRAVDTVVTIKDGQSVVIGGLIQTSEEQRRTKVPILGDIPILGLPFRSKQDTSVKTELLVILTPRVIPGAVEEGEPVLDLIQEQTVRRLDDPSAVINQLERIRREVAEQRARIDAADGAEVGPGDPKLPGDAVGPPAPEPRR